MMIDVFITTAMSESVIDDLLNPNSFVLFMFVCVCVLVIALNEGTLLISGDDPAWSAISLSLLRITRIRFVINYVGLQKPLVCLLRECLTLSSIMTT